MNIECSISNHKLEGGGGKSAWEYSIRWKFFCLERTCTSPFPSTVKLDNILLAKRLYSNCAWWSCFDTGLKFVSLQWQTDPDVWWINLSEQFAITAWVWHYCMKTTSCIWTVENTSFASPYHQDRNIEYWVLSVNRLNQINYLHVLNKIIGNAKPRSQWGNVIEIFTALIPLQMIKFRNSSKWFGLITIAQNRKKMAPCSLYRRQ